MYRTELKCKELKIEPTNTEPFRSKIAFSYYFPVNRSDLKLSDHRPNPNSTKRLSMLIDVHTLRGKMLKKSLHLAIL